VPPRDLETLKALQERLKSRVRLVSDFGAVRRIGGVDVSYVRGQKKMVVALVVLDMQTLTLLESTVWEGDVEFPYIPTFLSFRELQGMVEAYHQIQKKPDVLLVDGQGIAHPRGLGIASHLGVELEIPTIGCAKTRLVGEYRPVCPERGCAEPLRYNGKQVGWVVRTRACVRPIFVSPGHRVSMEDALKLVLAATPKYRLPEPIRLADHISRQRAKELQNLTLLAPKDNANPSHTP